MSDFISDFRSIPFYRDPNKEVKVGKKHLPKNSIQPSAISGSTCGNFYCVMSETTAGVSYLVSPVDCTCTCPAGVSGSVCKHIIAVHLHTDATIFTLPPQSLGQRNQIHEIAFGKPPSDPNYYGALCNIDKTPGLEPMSAAMELGDNQIPGPSFAEPQNVAQGSHSFNCSVDDMIHKKMEAMIPAFASDNESKEVRGLLKKILRTVTARRKMSKSSFLKLQYEWFKNERRKNSRSRINVNAASISRRRQGLSKGKGPAPKGPPKKRSHDISKAWRNNQANAKKH